MNGGVEDCVSYATDSPYFGRKIKISKGKNTENKNVENRNVESKNVESENVEKASCTVCS